MPPQSQLPGASPHNSKQRQQNFLSGLATIMSARNTPLPPSITGAQSTFDPASSHWNSVEPASEIGGFKLAGKDVDLFKLWGLVFQFGGSAKLQQAAWGNVAQQLGLPERLPHTMPNGMTLTSQALASYYTAILGPFEDAYLKNYADQRKLAIARQQQLGATPGRVPHSGPQQQGPGSQAVQLSPTTSTASPTNVQQFVAPGSGGTDSVSPQTPHRPAANPAGPVQQVTPRPTMSPSAGIGERDMAQVSSGSGVSLVTSTPGNSESDASGETRKRKQVEDTDMKRVRRKTVDSESPTAPSYFSKRAASEVLSQAGHPSSSRTYSRGQPSRRKIEYVPLVREIESAGGRDVANLTAGLGRFTHGRPLRDTNDWGTVDVDALTMSLRSRLSTELSYALTTLTLLSMMTGKAANTGFPAHICPELIEEILDLLEETAFSNAVDANVELSICTYHITTYHDIISRIHDEAISPFPDFKRREEDSHSTPRPLQRPADIIRMVVNILRNFSVVAENQPWMAQHPILLDLVLRVSGISPPAGNTIHPASKALTLSDLVVVPHETRLSNSPTPTPSERQRARYIFELIASYIVDPTEALTPITWLVQSGFPLSPTLRPPSRTDSALEVFTRISLSDANRQVFSQCIPSEWMWCLLEALVHRLPVVDHDFQMVMRESWLSYVEKVVMAIYSLAFFMPPEMKKRVKTTRSLGFAKIMLRMVKKFTLHPHSDYRGYFHVCARRAIEAMKLVDDCEDSFDTSQQNVPMLSFGMGYGEMGDNRVERGTGLLGGHQGEVTWGIMMQREVDEVMFSELESLTRIEYS
ncbi:hypothetical protein BD410DRAFT_811550 [Rickenella mellea]|uniref:ARID domain-containing protein n=1 Tax=Rickenella mellea TaxID=50990 RepID=A0A4Y7QLC0_9AGAM|nr:hypothetical protein BD410DRAFT_811550 [Rickenella mellea]